MEYHKIHSPWKRNEKGRFTDEWSRPEFGMLADSPIWMAEEKVDGTNIRIKFDVDSKTVWIGGRTDAAQIPTHLLKFLKETFCAEKLAKVFDFAQGCEVWLFGEGYGHKIQNGGKYVIGEEASFALFDIHVSGVWFERVNVRKIADELNLNRPEYLHEGPLTLHEAADKVRKRPASLIAKQSREAEGVILRPYIEMLDRSGARIITKLKIKDF